MGAKEIVQQLKTQAALPGPRFDSQNPCDDSQPTITAFLGDLMPLLTYADTSHECGAYTRTQIYTYMYKIFKAHMFFFLKKKIMLIQTALAKITQCVMSHLQEVGPVELGGRGDLVEGNVEDTGEL